MEELSGIVAKVPDAPLFANMIEGGKTPFLSSAELQALGFKMVVYPLSALFTAARSIGNVYRALKEEKTTARLQEGMVSFLGLRERRRRSALQGNRAQVRRRRRGLTATFSEWRARRDSNPQPSDPKSDALSN